MFIDLFIFFFSAHISVEMILCFKYFHYHIMLTLQLERENEKARRRRRSDPDFLQIPPPSKDQKTRQGGEVSVAKPWDKFQIFLERVPDIP